MPVIEITSLSHPGVEIFGKLTEAQLRNRVEPGKVCLLLRVQRLYVWLSMPDMSLWRLCASVSISQAMLPI